MHYCDLQAGFAPLPSDLASATVTAVTTAHNITAADAYVFVMATQYGY